VLEVRLPSFSNKAYAARRGRTAPPQLCNEALRLVGRVLIPTSIRAGTSPKQPTELLA